MTPEQEALAAAHGTPKEFCGACWNAYCDLMIDRPEFEAAVIAYHERWKAAGSSAQGKEQHD